MVSIIGLEIQRCEVTMTSCAVVWQLLFSSGRLKVFDTPAWRSWPRPLMCNYGQGSILYRRLALVAGLRDQVDE